MNFARLSPRSLHTVIAYRKIQMFSKLSFLDRKCNFLFLSPKIGLKVNKNCIESVDFLAFSTVCIFLAPIHRIH